MTMRFTIEERHLTDDAGRPVTAPGAVAFHKLEAETLDEALSLFMQNDEIEIIGTVLKFPGFQAVATIRKPTGVYTLQFTPASQQFSMQ